MLETCRILAVFEKSRKYSARGVKRYRLKLKEIEIKIFSIKKYENTQHKRGSQTI